jgi:SAM-dependent methyltransferase
VTAATDHRRRTSFDGVAELYDAARPDYPDDLVAALIDLAGLREGKHVLEIGPGTGQLSIALARSGVVLTAVELGPSLAAIARRRLAGFPHAQVVVADFDHWPVPPGAFDLVVAATAFHWLDPATRVRRCTSHCGGVGRSQSSRPTGVSAPPTIRSSSRARAATRNGTLRMIRHSSRGAPLPRRMRTKNYWPRA